MSHVLLCTPSTELSNTVHALSYNIFIYFFLVLEFFFQILLTVWLASLQSRVTLIPASSKTIQTFIAKQKPYINEGNEVFGSPKVLPCVHDAGERQSHRMLVQNIHFSAQCNSHSSTILWFSHHTMSLSSASQPLKRCHQAHKIIFSHGNLVLLLTRYSAVCNLVEKNLHEWMAALKLYPQFEFLLLPEAKDIKLYCVLIICLLPYHKEASDRGSE